MTGGLLVGAFGWSSVFLVTVPVSVTAADVAGRVLPEGGHGTRRPFDWRGSAAITGAAVPLVHGSLGADHGWTSPTVVAALTTSAALFVTFVAVERRTADPASPSSVPLPGPEHWRRSRRPRRRHPRVHVRLGRPVPTAGPRRGASGGRPCDGFHL